MSQRLHPSRHIYRTGSEAPNQWPESVPDDGLSVPYARSGPADACGGRADSATTDAERGPYAGLASRSGGGFAQKS